MLLPYIFLVLSLAQLNTAKSLKDKISGIKTANDDFAKAQRLKMLADTADAHSSPVGQVAAVSVDAATAFQLYTSDALPDPTPNSACASALTASIACNDTILQMA